MKYFLIGRNPGDRHITIDDPTETVSRVHGELSVARDGRLYYADRDSTNGSYRDRDGAWIALKRDYVSPRERLKLGDYVTTADDLLRLAPAPEASAGAIATTGTSADAAVASGSGRRSGNDDPHRLEGEVIWDDNLGKYVTVGKGMNT
ncbi:MAG: hypothetical protein COW30_12990 [Rhodospirillales bacterium CG15_BIG_FIL_POST_REV_8_21_14_020_66_15]|nr:MAG: hypothetical protein COW30_12990 [Rhodospirillales bacterium CG15_BIG_FIL_POST_REV_8_21_14_020_66_15]